MKVRNWTLGSESVSELYEYKNLGVVKNYIGSFSTNADENIEKTRKKAGMIFSSYFDRRKVSPLIYIKFWRESSNVLHSRALLQKSATGCLVHHYSYPLAQFVENYTLDQIDGKLYFGSNLWKLNLENFLELSDCTNEFKKVIVQAIEQSK